MSAPERIFSHFGRGHAHYWCSAWCRDNDCEFGPCCFPSIKLEAIARGAALVLPVTEETPQ